MWRCFNSLAQCFGSVDWHKTPFEIVCKEDFTRNGQQYDLILDVIASRSIFAYKRALKPNGNYFMAGGSVATMFQSLLLGSLIRRITSKSIKLLAVQTDSKDLVVITKLIEAGKVKLVIDKHYSLSETAEALRYLGEGHAKGKIVITVEHTTRRDP